MESYWEDREREQMRVRDEEYERDSEHKMGESVWETAMTKADGGERELEIGREAEKLRREEEGIQGW